LVQHQAPFGRGHCAEQGQAPHIRSGGALVGPGAGTVRGDTCCAVPGGCVSHGFLSFGKNMRCPHRPPQNRPAPPRDSTATRGSAQSIGLQWNGRKIRVFKVQ
jgi:hypothetical protein